MASVSALRSTATTRPPKRRLTRSGTLISSPPPALGHEMIRCAPGEFEKYRKTDEELKSLKRGLREFYQRQNEILDGFKEAEEVLTSTLPDRVTGTFSHRPISDAPSVMSPIANDDEQAERQPLLPNTESKEMKRERMDKIALNVNILVNILLLGSKGAAVLLSNSMSLLASFVDSALDFLSTLIIWGADFAAKREDRGTKYPTGKKRFEPLGVLIFSVCMIASFSQVLVESLKKLFGEETDVGTVSLFGKATMGATIAIKGIIWVWCSRFRSSGIQALAQDAKNDVFFNIFSLIIPWVGEILSIRQLDPLGGALLSLYIISEWVHTLLENFGKLSGRIASSDHHFRILYLILRFQPVLEVSYLEVYHVGDELIVEVDIILPSHTTLPYAHDVGETIQASIEALDLVSRAYVHLDYTSANPAQHKPNGST
ncbi:cation efflux family-domain-containing protein [Mycena albidolilacea]|uniref:Cation efflux family-domain-containing protein n=1 Tax=Mycena albidolilacea TaxID=1033008 RepID=A0AAD7F2N4_9AGAR|nr:cation efflux family-domain-containing protein [Mycena albidolilacea]